MATVLLIEDNAQNRRLEKDLFEVAGYTVIESESAKDGIALAAEKKPRLIIMDVRLPDMRGTQAMQALRADERTRGIPVVFVTASAMPEEINQINTVYNCGYITKPINTRTFVKEVERYIGENGMKNA